MKKRTTLRGFLTEKKGLTAAFLISTLALAVVAPYKSYIMQWLIDAGNRRAAVLSLLTGIGVILASHILEYFSRDTFTRMACRGVERARGALAEGQLRKPLSRHLAAAQGEALSLFTGDMRQIYDDYYMNLFNLVFWGFMGLASVCMLAKINPLLMLASLLLGLLPLLIPGYMAKRMKRTRAAYSENLARYTGLVGELLRGFETLAAFGAGGYFRRAQRNAARENAAAELSVRRELSLSQVLVSLLSWAPSVVILAVGVLLVFDEKISIGQLVTANSLSTFILSPMRLCSSAYAGLKSVAAVRERVEDEMNRPEPPDGSEALSESQSLSFEHVRFRYPGADTPVLSDMSFSVRRGEKIALVGASGGGKSTAIRLLFRYYDGYEGRVRINGTPVSDFKRADFYRQAAMIPQTPFVFPDTLQQNVCLYGAYSEAEVEAALREAGLGELIDALPDGLQTRLTGDGRGLSGGQAQRLAVARAMVRGCGLLLVDEATSSLDAATTARVMESLLKLPCTELVVTHDIFGDYMRRFDRVIVLENGRVAEEGSFDALLSRGGVFAAMYQNRAKDDCGGARDVVS